MSTLKHTPGPWHPVIASGCFSGIDALNDDINIVIIGDIHDQEDDGGVRGRTAEEAEANARLIASAPDLLAALKEVMPYIVGDKNVPWRDAQSAIAKAEGRAV